MNRPTRLVGVLSLTAFAALSACEVFEEPEDPTATPPSPTLTRLTPDGPSPVAKPMVEGTSVEGATVILYGTANCTGAQLGQVEVGEDGTFSLQLDVPPNVETPISANARRSFGSLSPCSGALTYTHDDIPPEPAVFISCSPASPSNANTLKLFGTAEPNAELVVYADETCEGTPVVEARTDPLLDENAGVSVDVADDSTTLFRAIVIDAAGNSSGCAPDSFEYIEDSTAPAGPTVTAVAPTSPSPEPNPTIAGSAEDGSRVSVHSDAACSDTALLGEGPASDLADGGTISFAAPLNATTRIYVMATDAAGNPSECVDTGIDYTHDDNAPIAPTLAVDPGAGSAADITLTGTAEAGADVELFDNDSCNGTAIDTTQADATTGDFSFAQTVATLNGDNVYSAWSRDAAGQASGCAPAVTYTHDDVTPDAPVLGAFDPGSPSTSATDTNATGTGEASALVEVFASADCSGTALASGQVANDGSFSVPVSLPANAVTPVSARQTDLAGNSSNCGTAASWMHDDTAPSLTLVTLTATSPTSASVVYGSLTDNVSTIDQLGVQVCISADPTGCDPFTASDTPTATGDGQLPLNSPLLEDTRYYAWGRPVDAAGNTGDIVGPVTGRTMTSAGTAELAVGTSHSCAVTVEGGVTCFGVDDDEQLGTPGANANTEGPGELVPGLSDVVSVGVGVGHTCALTSTGSVYCWGDNTLGQTSNTGANGNVDPLEVPLGGKVARELAVGANHTCALLTDGGLLCWGAGTAGQLGDGNFNHNPVPVAPVGATGIRTIAAGDDHTCAITLPGQVWCWGSDDEGQLGNGAASHFGVAVQAEVGPVVAIGVGARHSCAILDDGTARCWGDNGSSQLGTGLVTATVDAPTDVQLLSGVVAITGGDAHTCALQADGDAFCWGANGNGQLGDGTTVPKPSRIQVAGGHTYVGISASNNSTCGWSADGQAFCWGLNAGGNLGLGAGTDGDYSEPQSFGLPAMTQPARVVAGPAVSGVITTAGTLWLWGSGGSGLKGDAVSGDASFEAVEIPASGGGGFEQVGFGVNHACALDAAGTIQCWGFNDFGQVDGSPAATLLPPTDTGIVGAHRLAVGKRHACAILADRTVACWGDNGEGQLGTGDTVAMSGTNVVGSVTGAVDVAAGDGFSCAVMADGSNVCWGTETAGQLGLGNDTGTLVLAATPTPLVDGAVQVVAGEDHACVLTVSGEPRCWGDNTNGQLGHGTPPGVLTASAVTGATSATSLTAGATHTCAARLGNQVRCWGYGELGQLGFGSFPATEVTPQTVGLNSLIQVAAGGDHTCFMQSDRNISCAGANLDEQLGNEATGLSSPDPVAAPSVP